MSMQIVKPTVQLTLFLVFMSALPLGLPMDWTPGMTERFWAHTGSYSMQLAYMAFLLILVRIAYPKLKKQNIANVKIVAELNQYATKYHVPIGWSALILTIGHSIYYLILLSPKPMDTYSGLLATIGMLVVTLIGFQLQKNLRESKTRRWHYYVSIMLLIAVIVHNYYADVHAHLGLYKTVYGGH
ncbi:MAG: hypothetical protein ACM32O_03355 [Clostridia bacterium]